MKGKKFPRKGDFIEEDGVRHIFTEKTYEERLNAYKKFRREHPAKVVNEK